jgi:hypothetical protein
MNTEITERNTDMSKTGSDMSSAVRARAERIERSREAKYRPRRSLIKARASFNASKSRTGRIKLAVRRLFIISDSQPILLRQVLDRAYPKLKRFTSWHYLAARRALRHDAIMVARNRYGRGRPGLWGPLAASVKRQKDSD